MYKIYEIYFICICIYLYFILLLYPVTVAVVGAP